MAGPSPPRSPTTPPATATATAAIAATEAEAGTEQPTTPSESGIPYTSIPPDNAFSDALMEHILALPADTILPTATKPTRASLASAPTQPTYSPPPAALPLPLTSPQRTHKSALPNLLLTHPGGWLEGSAPPRSAVAAFTDDWLAVAEESGRTGPRQMVSDVNGEVARQVAALRACMLARRAAREENERIDKEIRGLQAERDMELRVIEETRRRREMARS